MALPATDNFNRANGGVGANWTALTNAGSETLGHQIVTNEARGVQGTTNHNAFSAWNADTFANDHYSQAKGVNNAAYAWPMLRMSSSGFADGYTCLDIGSDTYLYRVDDGTFTQLQTGLGDSAAGSILKMTAEGSSLKVYDDGVQMGTTQTDATYASGRAGIFALNDGSPTVGLLDDWEGGNIGGAAPAGTVFNLNFY